MNVLDPKEMDQGSHACHQQAMMKRGGSRLRFELMVQHHGQFSPPSWRQDGVSVWVNYRDIRSRPHWLLVQLWAMFGVGITMLKSKQNQTSWRAPGM